MTIASSIRIQVAAGPTIVFDCPHCGQSGVSATTQDHSEKVMLLHLIPLFTHRTTFVICSACQKQSLSTLSAAELSALPPFTVMRYIQKRVPLVTKFLVIAGLALFWLPFLGLPLSIVGLIAARKHKGWLRTTALIGTILSLLMSAFVAVVMLMAQ